MIQFRVMWPMGTRISGTKFPAIGAQAQAQDFT